MSISYTELSHFIHLISKYSSASCFPCEVTVLIYFTSVVMDFSLKINMKTLVIRCNLLIL